MKFLCDRCKTRYAIGDDRVRGKILKIRCKNCANVITVREGMTVDPDPSGGNESPGRSKKATMVAPTALNEPLNEALSDISSEAFAEGGEPANDASLEGRSERLRPAAQPVGAGPAGAGAPAAGARAPAVAAQPRGGVAGAAAAQGKRPAAAPAASAERAEPANALNAAFASAMAKPPPALEEEWYVSIDGDQAGPFSLAEAQHWVAQRPLDAELHCWSEGFDDWLPVDKVSHFRGLRSRSTAATTPPPFRRGASTPPRVAPGQGTAARVSAPVPVDGDPKPLFAATMAALERNAPVAPNPGLSLPSPGTRAARATPPRGAPVPSQKATAGTSNGAGVLARDAGRDRKGRTNPNSPDVPPRGADNPFDSSEGGDAETQLESMPFGDSFVESRRALQSVLGPDPAASSASSGRPASSPDASDAAVTTPHLPAASTLPGTGASPAMTSAAVSAAAADHGQDDDEELAIGEVSRVVKLADLARESRAERSGPIRRANSTTRVGGRQTGPSPILRSTGAVPAMSTGALPDEAPPGFMPGDPGDPADANVTMAPVAKAHRRGLIMLISVAGVMVLGVVAAVVLLVGRQDEPAVSSLGPVHHIDTSRPEDPVTHRPIEPTGSASPTLPAPPTPRPASHLPRPLPTPNPGGGNREPDPPGGNSLRGDEIEDVARKHQDTTQRCYLRSQRGADAILIGDVKKIAVTLVIDKDGNVGDVQLSDHASDNLGRCLSGSIRGWKFRPSSGGTFRFSLNFVSG